MVDDVQPEVVRGGELRLVAPRGRRPRRAPSRSRWRRSAFSSASMPNAARRARPLASMRARSSSAARYTAVSWDSSAGFTMPLHVCCSGTWPASTAARCAASRPRSVAVRTVNAVAFRPGRLVFLDQPGADHVVDAAPGGVGVPVKMLVGQVCVGHGAIEPHVGHRIARAYGPAAARPVARLGVVRARGVFPPMAGGACLRVGRRAVAGPFLAGPVRARGSSVVRAGVARVRAGGFILAIPRILARPLGRVFLADAGKPGLVRLVVGALLRGPLGMLARAGGFLLKPLNVVAGGFLRPVLTISRRLVGGGAGVTGRGLVVL